jgi:hypothetical protein
MPRILDWIPRVTIEGAPDDEPAGAQTDSAILAGPQSTGQPAPKPGPGTA